MIGGPLSACYRLGTTRKNAIVYVEQNIKLLLEMLNWIFFLFFESRCLLLLAPLT